MWLKKRIKPSEIIELATRIDDLERKIKVLELDLDLYVKRLKASRGLGKLEKDTKDIKDSVLLADDGTFPKEE